jgi:DNA-binding NarL/FixJ family response regulator
MQQMSATPILAVTHDDTLLSLLRSTVRDHLGQKGRIVVAPSVEEGCRLMKTARPRLIVVHLTGDSGRYEQLDRLLWANSVVSKPTPVVVIAERYRIDQATMMYRMGVSEYISRKHHLDQLADVLGAYLQPPTLQAADEGSGGKAWGASSRSAKPLKARVV